MLGDVVPLLRCPHCAGAMGLGGGVLACSQGHAFDVARQGYVNLLSRRPPTGGGDTAAMVQARATFLGRGHYRRFASAVADAVAAVVPADEAVAEVGAGTAYYLATVLERRRGPGVALDVSPAAARRAAQAHPRVGSVVADVWTSLPLGDGCLGGVVVAFAPRSGGEVARVLRPGGHVVVLAAAPDHLQELRDTLGLLDVDPRKAVRLAAGLGEDLVPVEQQTVRWTALLHHDDVLALVLMGPNAVHQDPDRLEERLQALPDPVPVTASGLLHVLRRV